MKKLVTIRRRTLFKLVADYVPAGLAAGVQHMLDEGWALEGGVLSHGDYVCQAMTKEVEEEAVVEKS